MANIVSFTLNDLNQGWNSETLAEIYFHHSELQQKWSWELLNQITFLGNEKILDFGCGDGRISADLAKIVKNGSVLGVDISNNMLHLAHRHFPSERFSNLTFKKSESLVFCDVQGSKEFDLICAFNVFHLISEPEKVLLNLKSRLKSSGRLLFVTPTGKNNVFFQAANEMFAKYGLSAPWNHSKKGPIMRTLEGAAFFLKEAGYTLESLKIIDQDNLFNDLEDFIAWMIGTVTANWQIPFALSYPFFSDLASRMVELEPTMLDKDNHIHFTMPRIQGIAKPDV
ncbi:MAG TPA: class I SAM-dependent methyltransferase [Rhabdochlamydiaceae bacterium]|nr:class I SAM-dependent methyltransferase [Rhabdochlamydiaceae bacterium]HSX38692.1 class I SAM-dependent methyltransferase [Chlamydiales bacterium]